MARCSTTGELLSGNSAYLERKEVHACLQGDEGGSGQEVAEDAVSGHRPGVSDSRWSIDCSSLLRLSLLPQVSCRITITKMMITKIPMIVPMMPRFMRPPLVGSMFEADTPLR